MRFLRKSHSAENLKGGPLDFFNIQLVAKSQKMKGALWRHLEKSGSLTVFSEKKLTVIVGLYSKSAD